MSRILGIDFGLKRFGLALSDERQIIATSLGTLVAKKSTEETLQELLLLIHKHNIETIVIGNPLHLSGKMSFLADEVKHFVHALQKHTPLPIILWDERLTSVQANRSLQGLTRKKRSQVVDTVAAVILLQSYLDSKVNSEDP